MDQPKAAAAAATTSQQDNPPANSPQLRKLPENAVTRQAENSIMYLNRVKWLGFKPPKNKSRMETLKKFKDAFASQFGTNRPEYSLFDVHILQEDTRAKTNPPTPLAFLSHANIMCISRLPVATIKEISEKQEEFLDLVGKTVDLGDFLLSLPQDKHHAPDVLKLLGVVLSPPVKSNMYVYSIPGDSVVELLHECEPKPMDQLKPPLPILITPEDMKKFEKKDKKKEEEAQSEDKKKEEGDSPAKDDEKPILFHPAIKSVCFWCRRSVVNKGVELSSCGKCQVVSYCSKECQVVDWKAFHKFECKKERNFRVFQDRLVTEGQKPYATTVNFNTAGSGVYEGCVIQVLCAKVPDIVSHPQGWMVHSKQDLRNREAKSGK
eukprot:NODE_590_length_1342_cov_85.033745_g551_i0.p1 GENE.NODE_590_length_1342_cov_85.033745_g551_i0~~NODE_590_length_1342_cov_85.033745_g551_i0.p1  ORF type:complete len:378 (+),score=76.24 NODE_590_length_1342_cov_85.033745_g551_i0:85-1218(+)